MNPPRVYMCSPSWTLLPPHTIPLGHHSAPAPSILYPALNLDWRFVSYMILYMFQCHSPKSSHHNIFILILVEIVVEIQKLEIGQSSVQFSSVTQLCPTVFSPMDCSTQGFPVHHQLQELAQTDIHQVGDAIQPSHPVIPLSSCLQSFPASGCFPMSQFFISGGQSTGAQF